MASSVLWVRSQELQNAAGPPCGIPPSTEPGAIYDHLHNMMGSVTGLGGRNQIWEPVAAKSYPDPLSSG